MSNLSLLWKINLSTIDFKAEFIFIKKIFIPIFNETDPDCVDLDDADCPTGQSRTLGQLRCLEVDGDDAWFAADVVGIDPDPRFTPEENAQFLQEFAEGRLITIGRIEDNPDSRSLFITNLRTQVETIDNAVGPITPDTETDPNNFEVLSVATIAFLGLDTDEYCAYRDEIFMQADYVLRCIADPTDPLDNCVATGAPACTLPTVDGDGIGFDDDGSMECWINTTAIQWLDADDQSPLPGLVPNTILGGSLPPAEAIYDIRDIERTFEPGSTIVITDNQN